MDYVDLNENGDVDPPTPKRRRAAMKKGGGKGANKTKAGSGVGSGSKPPAGTRPKRTATAPTK